MPAPEMDIYIYYRVPLANTSSLQQRVQAMQQALARQFPIQCSLKRRPELSHDCQTWMEVYTQVPADFATALAEAVTAHALPALISGERHIETFVDIEACA